MAVTKGNKCSGESDFAEEKVDTLANPVPFVANPVSDVKATRYTYYRPHIISTPARKKYTNIYQ